MKKILHHDRMDLFGKLFKKSDSAANVAIPAEVYRSVHVMRDDINEMEGKPKESIPGDAAEDDPSQANNPFLGTESAGVPMKKMTQKSADIQISGGNGKNRMVIAIVVVLILLVSGLVAYFYLRGSDTSDDIGGGPTGAPSSQPVDQPLPTEGEIPLQKSPFSAGMPNYLQIDPESDAATPDGVLAKIADMARQVKEANVSGPVEFLVRDANNNPIAFSRFAYLAKLAVPEDILADLDESFSLYLVPDSGEIRFGLLLEMKEKDQAKLQANISSKESAIPTWFGRLLYDRSVQIPAKVTFRNGTYGTIGTKFTSVNAEKNYSLDYAFIGKKWIIGTSKDSFRSVLDTIVTGKEK